MEEIIGGRISPISVTIIPVVLCPTGGPLLSPLINKGAVTTSLHVPVPAQLFEVFGSRLRAPHGRAQRRPEVAKPLASMSIGFALEARQGHPRKVFRRDWLVAHTGKHHRRQAVLAIATMIIIGPLLPLQLVLAIIRLMLPVGDRTAVHIVTEEIGRPGDRGVDLGVFYPSLLAQHDGELRRQTRLVHRPIPTDRAVSSSGLPAAGWRDGGKAMARRSKHTRVLGRVDDILAQSVKHLSVSGKQVILGQKNAVITIPRRNPTPLQIQILGRERTGVGL